MIGLLLITHCDYGESLIQCACHVFGHRPQQIMHLGVAAEDGMEGAMSRAREALKSLDTGEGVLIMTDIYGATPANLTMKLLDAGRIEGLSGLNLPMLLRALTYRDKDMASLLDRAASGGRDGILNMLQY